MGIAPEEYVSPEAIEERRQQVIAIRKRIEHNKTRTGKVCPTCKEEKALSEFYANGTSSHCKPCSKAKSSAFAKNNKEYIKGIDRKKSAERHETILTNRKKERNCKERD